MDFKNTKELAKKSAFVVVGAPVVVGRKVKDFSTKMAADAQDQIDEYAVAGEKVAKQLQDRNVVEEIEHRMNIDKVQDRVEQLRDQLENTLNNWRESFAPEADAKATPAKATATKAAATKPAAKKAPAKKASAKKAPAAKKTTAKKAPAKKAPAKKAPTAKKATAKASS